MSRYSFQSRTLCPFCGKILNSGGGNHIYKCINKPCYLTNDEVIVKYCVINYPEISKKEVLDYEYNTNLMSLPDLYRKYNIPSGKVTFLLDYYGLHRRKSSESCIKCAQPKIKATCLEKYGTTNVLSKGTIIYDKRNKTVMDKYGVTTVFKLPQIKEKIINDDTYITRYGITRKELISKKSKAIWERLDADRKIEWLNKSLWNEKTLRNKIPTISHLEIIVSNSLTRLGILHDKQFLLLNDGYWKYYDFRIVGTNILLEVNGNWYHANSLIYKYNDIIVYPERQVLANHVWDNDNNKRMFAESLGYKVIYIWENEIRSIKRYNNIELDKFISKRLGIGE